MPTLSIKDVPDELAEQLRQRAARNHRSLQGEMMAILEQAMRPMRPPLPVWIPVTAHEVVGVGRIAHPLLPQGTRSLEQIAAEHRERFPKPVDIGPRTVDIVQAEHGTQ
jgi:plasmid stability protein